METLILFGSPKQNGNTAALLEQAQQKLIGKVVMIDCYQDAIAPCIDCDYCKTHAACFMPDEMEKLYQALRTCNRIVLASPIFFSELTGRVFDVMSRLQMFYRQKEFGKLPEKKGLILLAAGGAGNPQPALDSARRLMGMMRATEIQEACSLHTDALPAAEDAVASRRIEQAMEWFSLPNE